MHALLLFVLVTGGALVSSLTGLGGGTIILAGLLLVYPPEIAIPLHSFTQLSANSLRVGLFYKTVRWDVVLYYSALMIPAAWLAAWIFDLINPSWLKLMVGTFILISVFPFAIKPKGEPRKRTFMILGAISGFIGVFIGSVGPFITPFFNRLKIGRNGNIATKNAGQGVLQVSKIIAFWGATSIDFGPLKDNILLMILGTLVGVGLSIPVSRKISDEKFDLLINIMLGLIASKVIYEGIIELWFSA